MTIRVEKIRGNIRTDTELRKWFEALTAQQRAEKVLLSRKDAAKNRLRVTSDKGREVIIDVPRGTLIRNGDVLEVNDEYMLVVEWSAEETAVITANPSGRPEENIELGVKLGYILGIKHWPLAVDGNSIYIPIESSREAVTKAFSHLSNIEISYERRIVEPHPEDVSHEHHL